ncbi:MAG: type IV pilus secretin PilQ [Pseudomonadota bacterium]|nr:type IV pilus secretin PilQ [Pseudomonadota bacterium]
MPKSTFKLVSVLFFIVAFSSCAAKSKDVANLPSENSGKMVTQTDLSGALAISESLGKTIIDIPVSPETQPHAKYDNSNNIVVSFAPPIAHFDIPVLDTSLVKSVTKSDSNGLVDSVTVFLGTKSKFLLSKQGENIARLMLVPDEIPVTSPLPTNYISSLDFRESKEGLQITAYSSLPFEVTPKDRDVFQLQFAKAQFLENLLKKYDLSQLRTPIKHVLAQNGDGGALLSLAGVKNPALSIQRKNDETIILVKVKNESMGRSKSPRTSGKTKTSPDANALDTANDAELQELNTLFPGMKEHYTGERISIDLQDADVELVLRLISEVSGYNLILDDEVSGKISLKLVDIPWDQALDLVLLQKNLGVVMKGNIMRVASAAKLEAERAQLQKAREAAIQAKASLENLAPLKTDYIQINYSTAADFEGKVKTFISPRGSVSSDPRTNILIVTDTEATLKRINSFIKKLDRAERQVMIEARVVYATDEFQRSLGVKWGTGYATESEENRPNEQWRGGVGTTGLNMINTVNGITLGGSIGKYLGKDLFALDASLQLGEAKNLVKTISSPRILTLNNNRAEIQQGTKLATATESSSGGTTTEYEEAVLRISVLPQITPDNKLILDLEINDDSPKSDGRDIDTKQTKTKMMVNDRETIVIGGVQKTTETTGSNKVPGVGDIPGLGWLFKNTYDSKSKAELLIFIQPRIL